MFGPLERGMHELTAGIGYQVGLWNVGFMAASKAIEFVADAFKNASNLQQNFIQQMNVTRTSTQEQTAAFEGLKKAAEEAGMGLGEDFQKFVMPAVRSLEELGLSQNQAKEEMKVMGQYVHTSGEDLRDLATKAEMGTASFNDLLKAGQAFGGEFQQGVLAWNKWTIAEQQATLQLQRFRQVQSEAFADTQRLTGAHEEFAQSTGLAGSVFQSFKERVGAPGGMAARFNIPPELANLGPGAYWNFQKLAGEQQKRLQEGLAQMAKEENLPLQQVQFAVRGGLPGFGEKELLNASQRARQEGEIARIRSDQADDFERQNAAEQARLGLNAQFRGIIKEQPGFEAYAADRLKGLQAWRDSLPAQAKKVGDTVTNLGVGIGDALNQLSGGDIAANLAAVQDIQARTARGGTVAGQANLANFPASPAMQELYQRYVQEAQKGATEGTLKDVGIKIDTLNKNLTTVFQVQ